MPHNSLSVDDVGDNRTSRQKWQKSMQRFVAKFHAKILAKSRHRLSSQNLDLKSEVPIVNVYECFFILFTFWTKAKQPYEHQLKGGNMELTVTSQSWNKHMHADCSVTELVKCATVNLYWIFVCAEIVKYFAVYVPQKLKIPVLVVWQKRGKSQHSAKIMVFMGIAKSHGFRDFLDFMIFYCC